MAPGSSPEEAADWSPARRLLFRFAFSYLLLYNLPFPLGWIPYVDVVADKYDALWETLVPWVGRRFCHLSITIFPNGSGDTTFNYVQIACYLAIAVASTVLWTALDRKRKNYARLLAWLRVFVRFSLASAMISYGGVKVIKSQFPNPTLGRLIQPIGDASPMGILWTFLGASQSYNYFSGAAEMVSGLLLSLRRTTLLGALLSLTVMSNVVVLNFSYDVPVKLYSFHLLAMAVFLVLPDLRRLADFFLFNRRVRPAPDRPLFRRTWAHRGTLALRTGLVVVFVFLMLNRAATTRRTAGDLAPRSPLYGIWNVDFMELDGTTRPPLVTEATRWRRMVVESSRQLSLHLMDDSRHRYNLEIDPKQGTLVVTPREDPRTKSTLAYKTLGPGLLSVEGTLGGQKIRARLHRVDESPFPLLRRGFHWINEYPFNR
ncbi:MAG TPA: hypothetical protein VFE33_16530 [Thermoanaerobaculia bacterium]|nr:hypothetical protein [Thermoanaerobaculia bacterium]